MSGLAVLDLENDNQKQWLKPAISYHPILFAIVTVMRVLVIQQAWNHREEDVQRLRDEGWEKEAAKRYATSIFSHTKEMVHRFMTFDHIRIRAKSHESGVAYVYVRDEDSHDDGRRRGGGVAGEEDMYRANPFYHE